jgi:hypothetical protein
MNLTMVPSSPSIAINATRRTLEVKVESVNRFGGEYDTKS